MIIFEIIHAKARRRRILISGLITILLTVSCSGEKPNTAAPPEITRPIFAVNTTLASRGQIQDYISLSGDIVAGSTIDVYSDTAGKVVEIYTSVGRWVNRGTPVAAVDPSRPGMTFRQSLVTAPIAGTIVAVPAQIGMTISQAVPLARITGGGALEIKLHIAERFVSKMALNLPCTVTLDAWPGDIFQGSISELSPTIDLASRTMEVRINVSDTGSKLKPGMFAKVKIITEAKEDIVRIPSTAMLSRFGEQYVYVVQNDPESPEYKIVKKRNVVPGILIDGILEIQDGLSPDEEVVARGQTLLEDGVRVNVIERQSI
ncbi:MAG: efflux RND transporter periplasmic adaptor subunit [Treponema sp.]|nr:efflux RND transporter periplasmic adaptor subunit [Treponema sp.]MCL2271554.1 efflux RND transporter periplasmic adaptor subunit [Treponema sp.]